MFLRPATATDLSALRAALLEAANWDGRRRTTAEQLVTDPHLAGYLRGWPDPGDLGIVAGGDDDDGEVLGAAWCRLFEAAHPGYGYLADDIPELTIGVAPAHRGRGVGSALLVELVARARERGYRAMSLSVEDGNRAKALYERVGFTAVGRNGASDTMRLDIDR